MKDHFVDTTQMLKPKPMKNETIKSEWSLRSCFEQMRDANGDVMLTKKQQEEIIRLVEERSGFILVSEQEPPHNTELLAKSPTGVVHLCSWRPAYNIFTCQDKRERSWDWSWKLI
jgi:hypothetical protein